MISGIRCAAAFADADSEGGHWSWPTQKVLRYLAHFRNAGTAANYVSYLKFALQFHPVTNVWDNTTVARALQGARKASFSTSAVSFSCQDTVALGRAAAADGDVDEALAYHLAYSFTSRMQSEIWPLRSGLPPSAKMVGWHSAIIFDTDKSATIEWEKRKNTSSRTAIRAACRCDGVPLAQRSAPCGSCALRDLYKHHGFSVYESVERKSLLNINADRARQNLKRRVKALGISKDSMHTVGFHGFRRGRAKDEYQSGTPISRILELGGWRSAAVLRYLAVKEIDQVAVLDSAVCESSSDC